MRTHRLIVGAGETLLICRRFFTAFLRAKRRHAGRTENALQKTVAETGNAGRNRRRKAGIWHVHTNGTTNAHQH